MKNKPFLRMATLIMGLGFAASTVAIGLSSFQNSSEVSKSDNPSNTPDAEAQIQSQIGGFEKVLEREPKNATALQGLAQIYLQRGNLDKAVPIIEKLVKYYPQQQQYATVLQVIKQQQAIQKTKPKSP